MRVETRPHPAPCRGNRHPERNTSDTLPRLGDLSESAVSWLELRSPVSRGFQRPQTDRSEIGPYLGSHWATSWSPTTNSASPGNLRGGAISPKAPTSADTDRRRAGPLGDRSLPRRSLGYIPESYYKPSPIRKPPRYGDFSQSANVCRHGPPQTWTTAGPARSEIGPYLGSHWATSWSPTTNSASPGNLRGGAISPKAPRLQTRTVADMDHRRARPLGDRSFPGSSTAPSASLLLAGVTLWGSTTSYPSATPIPQGVKNFEATG